MTKNELFIMLKNEFKFLLEKNDLNMDTVNISAKSLTPLEAIGLTKRKDYPILTGSEIMLQAKYKNSYGQAFTNTPSSYSGTLQNIADLDISSDPHGRSIFIATLNAIKNELCLSDNVIHCKNSGPETCALYLSQYIKENYTDPNILLVGFQPAMISQLAKDYSLRVLDLNPENIGTIKEGVLIEHGIENMTDGIDWSDLILCTGSTLCNGSITNYLDIDKEVLFFGTTISGSADFLNAKRICFSDLVNQ